jgi:hypothetical protein
MNGLRTAHHPKSNKFAGSVSIEATGLDGRKHLAGGDEERHFPAHVIQQPHARQA